MLAPEQNNERKNHLRPLAPKPMITPFLNTNVLGMNDFQNQNLFSNFAFPTQQWLSFQFATLLLLQQQQQQQQLLLLKYPNLLNLQQKLKSPYLPIETLPQPNSKSSTQFTNSTDKNPLFNISNGAATETTKPVAIASSSSSSSTLPSSSSSTTTSVTSPLSQTSTTLLPNDPSSLLTTDVSSLASSISSSLLATSLSAAAVSNLTPLLPASLNTSLSPVVNTSTSSSNDELMETTDDQNKIIPETTTASKSDSITTNTTVGLSTTSSILTSITNSPSLLISTSSSISSPSSSVSVLAPTSTSVITSSVKEREEKPILLNQDHLTNEPVNSYTETSILASGTVQRSSTVENIFPKYSDCYAKTILKEKENYMKLSVQELKNLLKQKRKKVCGKKEALVERLIMSSLDEINAKVKNELLCKLNLIKDFNVNNINSNNRHLYSKIEKVSTKPSIPSISKKISDTDNKVNEEDSIIKKEDKKEKENEKDEEGCVASRVRPIAEVLKSIKGEENSISDQYYRIKRKFEYQDLMKTQQQQQHHHHNSVKKLKYF